MGDWEDFIARAGAHLDKVWPKPRVCPICAGDQWTLGPSSEVRIEKPKEGSEVYRQYPAVCLACGHIHWFSTTQGVETRRADEGWEEQF